jgi:hypothetical protein
MDPAALFTVTRLCVVAAGSSTEQLDGVWESEVINTYRDNSTKCCSLRCARSVIDRVMNHRLVKIVFFIIYRVE